MKKKLKRFLSIGLILLLFVFLVAISTILAFVFNGGEFLLRFILIMPFSFGTVYLSVRIWELLNNNHRNY